ncbi:MAG: hypothetical protein N3A66_01265, partial [Planctomycetota bacterium]|nr:hypothetical protein [Planctomycetota bacterium]
MPLFATLRRRIFAILAVAITLFAGGTYGFASWYLRRVFTAAEEEEVRCHLTRYRGAIGERLRDLRRQIEQADARQRCLRLLAMSAEDFGAEQRRLALNDPQQRWLALIAENGEILAGRGYNAENAALLPVPSALGRHFAGASPLRLRLANSEVLEGILLLPEDPPLMVAATLVANEGATAALVAAQALCLREISRLCQSGYLSVSLKRWEAAAPATAHRLLTSAAAGDIFSAAGEDETSALCLLRDIYGKPALLLEMRLPR